MWPRNNLESWEAAKQNIEEHPEDAFWSAYKHIAHELLAPLEQMGLNQVFRAGYTMAGVIFSTLDHHRLRGEPHVTLMIDPGRDVVRIAYSYQNISFHEPVSEQTCRSGNAVEAILSYLNRLWSETKPSEPMPPGLSL